MSSHPSLVSTQKPNLLTEQLQIKESLQNVQKQTANLIEKIQAEKPSPISIINNEDLIQIIQNLSSVYERINMLNNDDVKAVLKENFEQFNQISSKFLVLLGFLDKLSVNADLEREVLDKIKRQLPP